MEQAVQVHEEPGVAEAGRLVDPVDDGDSRRGAHQGIERRLGLVEGLDQEDRADPVGGPRREDQVLQRERVLLGRLHALDTVAVQRVEGLAAQRPREVGRHVDVGAEPLLLGAGDRQRAPVGAGQLSGVEVQPRQLDARVLDRLLQGVEFGTAPGWESTQGHHSSTAVKPAAAAAAGALQEREFGEEDRQVDVEALLGGC